MLPRSALGVVFSVAAAVGVPVPAPTGSQDSIREFGLDPFPGAVPAPELAARLDSLRTVRWITARVFLVEAPLAPVLAHLRDEQSKRENADLQASSYFTPNLRGVVLPLTLHSKTRPAETDETNEEDE